MSLEPSSAKLSCYSSSLPPELDVRVVVKVEQVDEYGIWGSLPDWGCSCKAYLPMGSMARERGRGERRAQKHFYTRARRLCAKGKPLTFVGFVQDIEQVSSNAVDSLDIEAASFHVTVSRRGITEEEEGSVMELSGKLQRYARQIVDKAANMTKVSPAWARELVLYEAYHRALRKHRDQEEENDVESENVQTERAAIHLLLSIIGKLPSDATGEVITLLDSETLHQVHPDELSEFAGVLLRLCREERERLSKPVPFSVTASIGGCNEVSKLVTDVKSECVSDLTLVSSALASASSVPRPDECGAVAVSIKGSGKYTFSTEAPTEKKKDAMSYLETVVTHVQQVWKETAKSFSSESVGNDFVKDKLVFTKPTQLNESMQPSLNIGVIGDVANGKSTLVKAMSGKRTQAHSSEQQQHGITIRLGFANAVILQCTSELCASHTFFPESLDKPNAELPKCVNCEGPMRVAKRVSFIDCPGHAELMATMLAGASAFDGVILAAAANTPCPTPQAKQHLEAIKLSGVMTSHGNQIAVAQTKAELVAASGLDGASSLSSSERLANHAKLGKKAMRKTIAADAPFFPVCSPMGLGLDPLAEWIANIEIPKPTEGGVDRRPRLTVLRSFDVNHPGKGMEDLVGGVLGGTINGAGSIDVGDKLEVRPGIFVKPQNSTKKARQGKAKAFTKQLEESTENKDESNETEGSTFRVQPLVCYCTTLMTGKTPLASATKGGLIAVGTTLCPSVCASNGLVGAVVGPCGTLPPVWGPNVLLNELELVNLIEDSSDSHKFKPLDPAELLKKKAAVRCHFGSASTIGQVVRVSAQKSKRIQVLIDSPVCAAKGSSVAIEAKSPDFGDFKLVAHARVFGGDECVPGADASLKDEADGQLITNDTETEENERKLFSPKTRRDQDEQLQNDELHRSHFLSELESRKANSSSSDTGSTKLSCPTPRLKRDGGAHVLVENFGIIASSIRRDPNHIISFLNKEGGLSCALAGSATVDTCVALRIKWRSGRGFAERFFSILKRYIKIFVTCHQCRGAVTEILVNSEFRCRRCNASRFVPKL